MFYSSQQKACNEVDRVKEDKHHNLGEILKMNPSRVYKRPELEPPPTIDIKAGMSKLFVQKKSESIIRRLTISKMQSASKKNDGSSPPKKKNQDLKTDLSVKLNYPIEHVYNDDVDEHFIYH